MRYHLHAERLAALRKARNLTLMDLEAKTEIYASNLSRLERRDRSGNIYVDTLARLAVALGCTTDYLLGLDDAPQRHDTTSFQEQRR